MSVPAGYHHRWLRRPVSTYWWLEKPAYLAFILREGSCMFVAWFVLYLLLLVRAALAGETSYAEFLAWSATPGVVALNVVTFAFVVYHAVTFFDAAPRAMVLRVGRTRVPAHLVRAGHYAAWLAASLLVAWLLLARAA
ncbi:MAG: fumarate reductase subunit C [Vicinamibacterales bacterium]